MRGQHLNTVCEEARCPNIAECWGHGTATFMILGDVCTRACAFCAVKSGKRGGDIDWDEPRRVGEAVATMGLRHAVVTSVDRDDLADGGAGVFAATIRSHPGALARDHHRGADARLPGRSRRAAHRHGRDAGDLQPQRRDRRPPLPPGAAEVRARPQPRAAPGRQAARAAEPDQVRAHGRPRRGDGRGQGAARPDARARHRDHHDRPVPASRRSSTTR